MEISTPTRFERLDGTGETIEYSDGRPVPSLLVYIDLYKDSELASVTVFDPSSCKSREWGPRPLANAQGIADRHLARLGYTKPESFPQGPMTIEKSMPRLPDNAPTVALTGKIDPPVSVNDFEFGIAGGAKYVLRCSNHPENVYRTKNPWSRSIFKDGEGADCSCRAGDLLVIWAPEDAH